MIHIRKLAFGSVTLLLCTCLGRTTICPNETKLWLSFYKPSNNNYMYLNSSGNKIDTTSFTIYGLKNSQKYPFSDLPILPVDISANEMTYIFERKNRKDTIIIQYELERKSRKNEDKNTGKKDDGLFLQAKNYSFIKNTFNESDTLIHCAISAASLYE